MIIPRVPPVLGIVDVNRLADVGDSRLEGAGLSVARRRGHPRDGNRGQHPYDRDYDDQLDQAETRPTAET